MKRITLLSALFLCTLTLSEAAGSEDASISAAVEANNAFGLDLYRQLAAKNKGKNLFFSSYSVLSALTMTAEGAREHTAKEMKAVMHLPEDLGIAHNGLSMLNTRYSSQSDTPEMVKLKAEIEKLKEEQKVIAQSMQNDKDKDWQTRRQRREDPQYWQTWRKEREIVRRINKLLSKVDPTQITVANALWGEKTYPFKQAYIDRVSGFYGTGALQPADFKGAFDAERVRVNTWVEKITRERIKDLLPAGSLNQYTRLVLANAIYFKGEWVEPFKKEKTKKEDFTLKNGQKVKVSLMKELMKRARYGAFNADGSFFNTPEMVSSAYKTPRYPGKGGFSIIELPYRGGKLAMVILAPNSPDGLGAIEKQLDAKSLDGWIGLLKNRKVLVRVPKFRSETEYKMNDMLAAMGMVSAFKMPNLPGGANFKGMTDTQNPKEQLYITVVQHKAFVAVDEKGTEAAAATAVGNSLMGTYPETSPFTPEFWADRPFLFLIRDVKTGCILFIGRMMKP
jgi:serpin B